jgi:transposase
MGKNNSRKTFDVTFKKMIVDRYETGVSVSQLIEDYDLKEPSVYSWIKLYGSDKPRGNAGKNNNDISNNDINQMQRRIKQLETENETLKKCITIFSRK